MIPVREGDLLAGKYRVERVLGVGGMGVVVAARHEQLGQLVAIKFVREDALGNEEAVERFLREARSAVRLKSDHVARVIDVGKLESGAPYMVMEFLEGDDLGRVLELRGVLAPDLAAMLVIQACEAVAEAHAAGIVHRDLKPQNLFLTTTVAGNPKVKVLDFGVSKSTGLTSGGQGALTRTRSVLGSPLYMAPEQMRSAKDVDARADVWALGVVLFELLTRRWPFEAENMPELCLKVVSEPPQSLLALRPDAPLGLVKVVERCLQKDPAARFADAATLAAALEPFAAKVTRGRLPSLASLAGTESATGARAESLVGSAVQAQSSAAKSEAGSRPTLLSEQVGTGATPQPHEATSSHSGPTPSTWGSAAETQAAGGAARSRRGVPKVALAGGAGLVVAIAILVALSARRSPEASSVAPEPPSASALAAAPSLPSAAPVLAAPPSVTAALEPVTAPPAPPAVTRAAAAADAGAARVTSLPSRPVVRAPPPPPPQRSAKPEDDIPALR